jgi:hypothetical protein
MTGLKKVLFYDNDTLLWAHNAAYSPVASQYVIAIYEEGFAVIDYVAQTAMEVRSATYFLQSSFKSSHLQQLQVNCVLPLSDHYVMVGTNGHLCIYNMITNEIQNSVAHVDVTHLLPYKKTATGSLVVLDMGYDM